MSRGSDRPLFHKLVLNELFIKECKMKIDKSKNGRRDFLKGAAITAAAATGKPNCVNISKNKSMSLFIWAPHRETPWLVNRRDS